MDTRGGGVKETQVAIITSGDLSDLYYQRTFRANGSTVTLKKISETDWMLIGDLADGDSGGFPVKDPPLRCDVVLSWKNQEISSPILTSWQEGVGVFNYNSSEHPDPVGQWVGTPPTPIQSITITENGSVFITLVEAPISYVGGYQLSLTDGTNEWYFNQNFSGGSGTTELHLTGPTLSKGVFNNAPMCLRLMYFVQS